MLKVVVSSPAVQPWHQSKGLSFVFIPQVTRLPEGVIDLYGRQIAGAVTKLCELLPEDEIDGNLRHTIKANFRIESELSLFKVVDEIVP